MNKRVAILTTFDNVQEAYSLNIVAQMQLKMLLLHGYKPVFIASKGFSQSAKIVEDRSWDRERSHTLYSHQNVEIREYEPVKKGNSVADYKNADEFVKEAERLAQDLEKLLADVDVVITHDLIYQADAVKHNLAGRLVTQKLPKLRWLHWVHSATPPAALNEIMKKSDTPYLNLVKQPFPNSFIVYPNAYQLPGIANIFGVDENLVKCVNHPHDYTQFFDEQLERLIFEKKMLDADFICTYPLRLDRGKQVGITIKIMAALKEQGHSIRLIIADFHSTDGDKVDYRQEMKNTCADLGVTETEVTWLSEVCPEWKTEVSHKIINDLFSISNVFILPSKSETYSLITQEAARYGNILILNQDFPPIRSIYREYPLYRKFSSNVDIMSGPEELHKGSTKTVYHPSEFEYWKNTARLIVSRFETDTIAKQMGYFRKTKNLQAIFRRQIEPLINKE